MYIETKIESREELLSLANKVGEVLRGMPRRDGPWIITLGASASSGKSLLALGIDEIFNPSHYPDGVTRNASADHIFNRKVVFNNFRWLTRSNHDDFDQALHDFEHGHPAAKVLIASNLDRTLSGNFNYETLGMCSKRLDLNIDVHMEPGSFRRRICLATENERLAAALSRIISSAPLPPA